MNEFWLVLVVGITLVLSLGDFSRSFKIKAKSGSDMEKFIEGKSGAMSRGVGSASS
jgi:hypothetical protein